MKYSPMISLSGREQQKQTLAVLEKQVEAMIFTVFLSFQIFFRYKSIMMSNAIFTAVALLSLMIVHMKFCNV